MCNPLRHIQAVRHKTYAVSKVSLPVRCSPVLALLSVSFLLTKSILVLVYFCTQKIVAYAKKREDVLRSIAEGAVSHMAGGDVDIENE